MELLDLSYEAALEGSVGGCNCPQQRTVMHKVMG